MELSLKECVNYRDDCPICGGELVLTYFFKENMVEVTYDDSSIFLECCVLNFDGTISVLKPHDRSPLYFLKSCKTCAPDKIRFYFNFNEFEKISQRNQYGYFFEVFCFERIGSCNLYEELIVHSNEASTFHMNNILDDDFCKITIANVCEHTGKLNLTKKRLHNKSFSTKKLNIYQIIDKIDLIITYS